MGNMVVNALAAGLSISSAVTTSVSSRVTFNNLVPGTELTVWVVFWSTAGAVVPVDCLPPCAEQFTNATNIITIPKIEVISPLLFIKKPPMVSFILSRLISA
jgi:hypothetical protein